MSSSTKVDGPSPEHPVTSVSFRPDGTELGAEPPPRPLSPDPFNGPGQFGGIPPGGFLAAIHQVRGYADP